MNKIYTRSGDKGLTSIVGGKRVNKCCERIESYGTIDELNSHIGMLIALCDKQHDIDFLLEVQSDLFIIGGYLATDSESTTIKAKHTITNAMVEKIEHEIDNHLSSLPQIARFVLPGGCTASAQAHICRTVCRRAERDILRLVATGAKVDDIVLAYINRLSDYFFTLARKINNSNNIQDIIWQQGSKQ